MVRAFGLQERELTFTAEMVQRDVHNNSAWNARFSVLRLGGGGGLESARSAETAYAEACLQLDADNEAAWAFLRGLHAGVGLAGAAEAVALRLLSQQPRCRHALALLADARLEAAGNGDQAAAREAAALFSALRRVDPVRDGVWALRVAAARAMQ